MSNQLDDLILQLKTVGFITGTKEVNKLRESLNLLNRTVLKTNSSFKKSEGALNSANRTISKYETRLAAAEKRNKKLKNTVDQLSGKKGIGGFLGLSDSIGKTIAKVALWSLSTSIVFGTIRAFKSGIATITEHDAQMIGLRKVYSGAVEDLVGVERGVLNVATAMKSLNSDAFEAAITVAKTGRTGLDIIELTEGALIAQNIAELEAADAVKFLNSALIQFNQDASQTIRILDEWNELSNKTPATTKDLAQAVSVAGSVFDQAGASIQFLNATTASLVEITAKSGNIVGRAERTMAIYAQRQKTVSLLGRIGIEVFDKQTQQFMGIDRLLFSVAEKWENMTDKMRTNVAQAIAGTRQQQFFIALMENQDLVLKNLAIQWDSFGSAVQENEKFLESIIKEANALVNSLERLAIKMGDAGLTQVIKSQIRALTGMINGLQSAQGALVGLATGVSVFAVGMIGGAKAVDVMTASMARLGVSIGAVSKFFTKFLVWFTAIQVGIFAIKELTGATNRYGRELDKVAEQQENIAKAGNVNKKQLESMVETVENLLAAGRKDQLTDTLQTIDDITKRMFGETVISNINNYETALDELREKMVEVSNEALRAEISLLRVSLARLPKPEFKPLPATKGIAKPQGALKFTRPPLPGEDLTKLFTTAAADETATPGLGQLPAGLSTELTEESKKTLEESKLILDQIEELENRLRDPSKERERKPTIPLVDENEIRRVEQEIQRIAKIFEGGISRAIASGFEGDEVRAAARNMADQLGNLLGVSVQQSLQKSLTEQGFSKFLTGAISGGVAGIATGIIGLFANKLFGEQSESDKQLNATEANTIQLRALNDTMGDLKSTFINAPTGFAFPAASGQVSSGGVASSIGGASTSVRSFDQRVTIAEGAVNVNAAKGQSATDVAAQVMKGLTDQIPKGAQTRVSF